jgi:hypothetical protein
MMHKSSFILVCIRTDNGHHKYIEMRTESDADVEDSITG